MNVFLWNFFFGVSPLNPFYCPRPLAEGNIIQHRLIKHTLSIVEKKKRFLSLFYSWVVLLTLKQLCMLPFFVKTCIFHYIVRIVFLSFAVFIVRDSLHKHHTTVFKKSDITIQQKIHKIGRKYHRFCDSDDSNPYTIFIDNFSFIFRVSPELCLWKSLEIRATNDIVKKAFRRSQNFSNLLIAVTQPLPEVRNPHSVK